MAVFRWGRRLSPKALAALGIDKKRKKAPCHATYHYVFQSIAADDLIKAPGTLVKGEEGLGHVAIDGKRLRGSQQETSPGIHMLQAFSTKLQAVVGTLVVPPDSGEAVEAIELIKSLPLEGAVVTGDAAFTFKPIEPVRSPAQPAKPSAAEIFSSLVARLPRPRGSAPSRQRSRVHEHILSGVGPETKKPPPVARTQGNSIHSLLTRRMAFHLLSAPGVSQRPRLSGPESLPLGVPERRMNNPFAVNSDDFLSPGGGSISGRNDNLWRI